MRIAIDTTERILRLEADGKERIIPLDTAEAFEVLSTQWLKLGWSLKYSYTFTWLGRPIIQLPEDMLRVQEVVYRLKPDVIVETGVAHGGSLVFYASLCRLMGCGRVIGIDIQVHAGNRAAIEAHELFSLIRLIEGSSTARDIVQRVAAEIRPGERVLVILDSCHTKEHVRQELELYHRFVTPGSYIVATDGIMRELCNVPGGREEWRRDNPHAAAMEFAAAHPDYILEQPTWLFNESKLRQSVTYWPGAWLRRR